ncbi:MAG: hypothetical protein JAY88_07180 [Candidatus Thiodiazotropha lotti]|nr:hypothetical protein [Candidatus Thiodiazotropha lotti]MCW4186842.1 hypothetical protein [Candidatus Thiodiazotropha lotti]
MKRRDFLEQWGLNSLKINVGFLEADFSPSDTDSYAAWDLYVELLTRVTTQALDADAGDEKTALSSIFAIFGLTREIMRKHGPGCSEFAKIAIPVLNQVIRPFTAVWHKRSLAGDFDDLESRRQFRKELQELQGTLHNYAQALASMAKVEDLTKLEVGNDE